MSIICHLAKCVALLFLRTLVFGCPMKLSLLGTYDSVGQAIWRGKTNRIALSGEIQSAEADRLATPPGSQLNKPQTFSDAITENLAVPSPSSTASFAKPADVLFLDDNRSVLDLPETLPLNTHPFPVVEVDESSFTEPIEVGDDAAAVGKPTIISVTRIPDASGAAGQIAGIDSDWLQKVRTMVEAHPVAASIDPNLGLSVIAAESSFNPEATSKDGHASKGLFQLLDATGRERLNELATELPYTPYTPQLNVALGMNHLHHLNSVFGAATDLSRTAKTTAAADSDSLERFVVAAFNAGEGRVARAQMLASTQGKDSSKYEEVESLLPESTREYVGRVLSFRSQLTP